MTPDDRSTLPDEESTLPDEESTLPDEESTLPDQQPDGQRSGAGDRGAGDRGAGDRGAGDHGAAEGPGAGTVLRERYVLEQQLASGATAAVWRAYDRQLRRTVAVKLLATDGGDAATRFRREATTAARLAHPGIVRVYDTGNHDGTSWLALEHVDGPDLLTLLRRHPTGLPEVAAAAVVEQAATALGVVHQREVVHRDVKPANLLLSRTGTVKVADLGVAVPVGQRLPPTTGDPVGTAAYAAPEQLTGGVDADPRMDVFALGVVLFEVLTGRAAFPSTGVGSDRSRPLSPRAVRAGVDRRLDAVVTRATDPDPDRRHRDGSQLAAELRSLVPLEPTALVAEVVAGASTPGDRLREGPSVPHARGRLGSRLRRVALLAVGVVVLGVTAGLLVGRDADDDTTTLADGAGTTVRDVRLFDPYGAVREETGRLVEVVDGDPATGWTTPAYPRPLRSLGTPGVGVRLDLGEEASVTAVELDLATAGATIEVLARQDLAPADATELAWDVVARVTDAPATVRTDTGGRVARHWLVWFTDLVPTEESWQATLTEIRFEREEYP